MGERRGARIAREHEPPPRDVQRVRGHAKQAARDRFIGVGLELRLYFVARRIALRDHGLIVLALAVLVTGVVATRRGRQAAAALAEAGAAAEHVVRTRTFLMDATDWEEVGRAHGELFRDVRPASTMIVVSALLDPRWLVEIEADALLPE